MVRVVQVCFGTVLARPAENVSIQHLLLQPFNGGLAFRFDNVIEEIFTQLTIKAAAGQAGNISPSDLLKAQNLLELQEDRFVLLHFKIKILYPVTLLGFSWIMVPLLEQMRF